MIPTQHMKLHLWCLETCGSELNTQEKFFICEQLCNIKFMKGKYALEQKEDRRINAGKQKCMKYEIQEKKSTE